MENLSLVTVEFYCGCVIPLRRIGEHLVKFQIYNITMATSREPASNQLEIEATDAVKECAPYVERLAISEKLVRTSGLIFLNLVTLEKNTYCVELTQKGWRITSKNLDSMNDDYRTPEFDQVYYGTMYALLSAMSPEFKKKMFKADVKLNEFSKVKKNCDVL
ncbi:hypothetical protein L596_027845 [Steinernema carpocapsae]|uniref:GSKIP domain-containing protein n=1 Tax=Steinernema carpocapsae TaxID=34508 RepID=A0A4U5LWQ7_STECR|nr:hypothetical protein L596_027845 [Steinernema carpocapsae]